MKKKSTKWYASIVAGAVLSSAFITGAFAADEPTPSPYTLKNNFGSADTIEVKSAIKDSTYNVYDSTGTLIQAFKAKEGTNTFKFKDQLVDGSTLSIKVAKKGEKEGVAETVSVGSPEQNVAATDANITVTNNVDTPDVVTVKGLPTDKNNKVTVIITNSASTVLGTGTPKDGTAEVKLKRNLGTSGDVIVKVVSKTKADSNPTQKSFAAEAVTANVDPVTTTPVVIDNFADKNTDVVTITKLPKAYDKGVFTVYSADGSKILGTAKISAKAENATAKVSIKPSDTAGVGIKTGEKIKVTLKEYNKKESALSAELTVGTDVSAKVDSAKVTVGADKKTIEVTGLKAKDKVSIYLKGNSKAVASATADTSGKATLKATKGFAGDYELKNQTSKYKVSDAIDLKIEAAYDATKDATVKVKAGATGYAVNAKEITVPANIKVSDLTTNILVNAEGATYKVMNGSSEALTTDTVTATLKVEVTAKVTSVKETYTIKVSAPVVDPADSDATVKPGPSATGYSVNGTVITVPKDALVSELKTNIVVNAEGATFEVYESNGSTVATGTDKVTDLHKVKVTAKDSTEKEYTITVTQ